VVPGTRSLRQVPRQALRFQLDEGNVAVCRSAAAPEAPQGRHALCQAQGFRVWATATQAAQHSLPVRSAGACWARPHTSQAAFQDLRPGLNHDVGGAVVAGSLRWSVSTGECALGTSSRRACSGGAPGAGILRGGQKEYPRLERRHSWTTQSARAGMARSPSAAAAVPSEALPPPTPPSPRHQVLQIRPFFSPVPP
jgi:hypothetical protein